MSLRHPLFVASLACILAGAGSAQDQLAARIAAAANANDWQGQLQQTICAIPIGELLDALLVARGGIPAERWPPVLQLVRSRSEDVERCWREQPAQRQPRAELFAALLPQLDWVSLHHTADAAARADIEVVAGFLVDVQRIERALRSDNSDQRASGERLARAAAAAIRARPLPPQLALLRRLAGTGQELQQVSFVGLDQVAPSALLPLLISDEPPVRARAAVALRLVLGLPVPHSLAAVLANDPAPPLRWWSLRHRPSTAADLPLLRQHLVENPAQFETQLLAKAKALPFAARRGLALAAIDVGLRVPLDAPVADDDGMPARYAEYLRRPGHVRARQYFGIAMRLDALAAQLILARAVQTEDAEMALRLLEGFAWAEARPPAVDRLAPLLVAMMQHRDARLADAASRLAAELVARQPEPTLLRAVSQAARDAVATDATCLLLQAPDREAWGGLTPTTPALLSLAAAKAGDATLLPALIGELQRLLPKPGLPPAAAHADCLLQALGYLAPHADAAQAAKLFELLHASEPPPAPPRFEARPIDEVWLTRYPGPRSARRDLRQLSYLVLLGLYGRLPGQHDDWYERHLPLLADLGCPFQREWYASLGDAHLRRLLAHREIAPHYPLLFLRAPDLLAAMHAGDDGSRAAAEGLLAAAIAEQPLRVQQLREARRLPDVLVAGAVLSSCRKSGLTDFASRLSLLPPEAACAPFLDESLVMLLESGQPAPQPAELPILRALSGWRSPHVALAASKRAAQLGEQGRALCRDALARLVAAGKIELAVLQAAVAFGFDFELPELERRLPTLEQAIVITDHLSHGGGEVEATAAAARLRFGRVDVASLQPRDLGAVLRAGADVDAAALRRLLTPGVWPALQDLLGSRSTATRIAALELAAEQPRWPEQLEAAVVAATIDPLPGVRIAAYRALRTRDPELWSCALLVHEAAFDPDPGVRAAAR